MYLLSNIYTFLSLIILGIEARAYDFPDTRPPHKNCTLYLSISGSNEFNITDLCIKNPGKCIRWFCLSNNLKDILLVGLKDDIIKDKIIAAGLQVSCYVQFHLPKEEVEMAKQSNGFVYLQAKPYETQQINEKYPTLKDGVEYLRSCGIDRPIYCGVGVHAPEDVKLVKEAGGDAAFVGSTILKLHEDIPAMKEKIREFKAMC